MARKRQETEMNKLDNTTLTLTNPDSDLLESVDLSQFSEKVEVEVNQPETSEPAITDPDWPDFVMKHFHPRELDQNGFPRVVGLRRVAQLLMGPILSSRVIPVQGPTFVGSGEDLSTRLQPAVMAYEIEVEMRRHDGWSGDCYRTTFSDVADVYFGNTEMEFARYPSAMAATRAEARCLRKLLRLDSVSAEEVSLVPAIESSVNGLASNTQITLMSVLGQRCDIDVMEYVNLGSKQYDRAADIPANTASKVIECLSGYQRNLESIPKRVRRGYQPNWVNN